jgi:signal transduction histidine kinase
VENLIGNALEYGSPGAPITISLKREAASVEVAVHNRGVPIPSQEIPLLFQNFRRAKSAHEGWGLGLTSVKGVVDAHQGKIRVESAEGKGTSFILEIPFRMSDPLKIAV